MNSNIAKLAELNTQAKVLAHDELLQYRLFDLFGSEAEPKNYDTFDQLYLKVKSILKKANNSVHRLVILKESFDFLKNYLDSFQLTFVVQNFVIVYAIIHVIRKDFIEDIHRNDIKTLLTKWFGKEQSNAISNNSGEILYIEHVLDKFEQEVESLWKAGRDKYLSHVNEAFKCVLIDKNSDDCKLQSGGKQYKVYNKRKYVVRTGKRGGKYIVVKGEKVYV